jgi:hypothetical protein
MTFIVPGHSDRDRIDFLQIDLQLDHGVNGESSRLNIPSEYLTFS